MASHRARRLEATILHWDGVKKAQICCTNFKKKQPSCEREPEDTTNSTQTKTKLGAWKDDTMRAAEHAREPLPEVLRSHDKKVPAAHNCGKKRFMRKRSFAGTSEKILEFGNHLVKRVIILLGLVFWQLIFRQLVLLFLSNEKYVFIDVREAHTRCVFWFSDRFHITI